MQDPCDRQYTCCVCNITSGELTYEVQDAWQARCAQIISAMITYNAVLASPWRISILLQVLNIGGRCPGKASGVDFYGRNNEMPFFHIPHSRRAKIAIALNLNTVFQLIHQAFHALWNEPHGSLLTYMNQPEAILSMLSGPVAGIITGLIAAVIQIRAESQLHHDHPQRFPPTPFESYTEIRAKMKEGKSLRSILRTFKEPDPGKEVKQCIGRRPSQMRMASALGAIRGRVTRATRGSRESGGNESPRSPSRPSSMGQHGSAVAA